MQLLFIRLMIGSSPSAPQCLTCDMNTDRCLYNSAYFSFNASYYRMDCYGQLPSHASPEHWVIRGECDHPHLSTRICVEGEQVKQQNYLYIIWLFFLFLFFQALDFLATLSCRTKVQVQVCMKFVWSIYYSSNILQDIILVFFFHAVYNPAIQSTTQLHKAEHNAQCIKALLLCTFHSHSNFCWSDFWSSPLQPCVQ